MALALEAVDALPKQGPVRRGRQPRALLPEQRAEVVAVLHEPRFQECRARGSLRATAR